MRIISLAFLALLTLRSGTAFAQPKFLDVDDAFRLSVARDPSGSITLNWDIANGHYLYRKRIEVRDAGSGAAMTFDLPCGENKNDPNFGAMEITTPEWPQQ